MTDGLPVPCARRALAVLLALSIIGCSSPQPTEQRNDQQLARLEQRAKTALEDDDVEEAARLYRRALERSYALDGPRDIADNAYNHAVCLFLVGRAEDAVPFLEEARLKLSSIGESAAGVELLEARIHAELGHDDEARQLIAAVRESSPDDPTRAQMHLLEARWASRNGDAQLAREHLAVVRSLMGSVEEPAVLAAVAGIEGDLLVRSRQPGLAAEQFAEQSKFLREIGRLREMCLALVKAAENFAAADNPGRAGELYLRVARSLLARKQQERARKYVLLAVEAARDARDETLQRRTETLLAELDDGEVGLSSKIDRGDGE